eukprot:80818-Amphidinium_carterae.1
MKLWGVCADRLFHSSKYRVSSKWVASLEQYLQVATHVTAWAKDNIVCALRTGEPQRTGAIVIPTLIRQVGAPRPGVWAMCRPSV